MDLILSIQFLSFLAFEVHFQQRKKIFPTAQKFSQHFKQCLTASCISRLIYCKKNLTYFEYTNFMEYNNKFIVKLLCIIVLQI